MPGRGLLNIVELVEVVGAMGGSSCAYAIAQDMERECVRT